MIKTIPLIEQSEADFAKSVFSEYEDIYHKFPKERRGEFLLMLGTVVVSNIIGELGQDEALKFVEGAFQQALSGEGYKVQSRIISG